MNNLGTLIGGLSLAAVLALSGCGSDSAEDNESSENSSPSASGRGPGFDSAQFQEIRDCLEAAGLADKFPSEVPTGIPSGMPSGVPSDFPSDFPSEFPSDLPSGMPSDLMPGGAGGGLAALQDPEVQEALEACGVELPQMPGGAG